jgi:hypothetical protein
MKNAALLLGVLIILGGVGWYLFSSVPVAEAPVDDVLGNGGADAAEPMTPTETIVDSFEDCVAAGNPVMESYPPRCRHAGVLYTATVSEPTPAPTPVPAPTDQEPVACTMDAKMCPDGSAVGRSGPNCEFAPCPGEAAASGAITCSPESRQVQACTKEYRPVCGLVEVQCVTTPCNPVPETFGNACSACAQGNVASFTPGACQ